MRLLCIIYTKLPGKLSIYGEVVDESPLFLAFSIRIDDFLCVKFWLNYLYNDNPLLKIICQAVGKKSEF